MCLSIMAASELSSKVYCSSVSDEVLLFHMRSGYAWLSCSTAVSGKHACVHGCGVAAVV